MDVAATRDDLRDTRTAILEEMRVHFARVDQKQDLTNGRINRLEPVVAGQAVKIRNLEKVFERPQRRTPGGDRRPITRRDLSVAFGTAAVILAVVKGLAMLVPLLHLVQP